MNVGRAGRLSQVPQPRRTGRGACAPALIAALLAVLTGCSGPPIDSEYGRRAGPGYEKSVNGTAVLADMFAAAGHQVSSRRALSPRLRNVADVIVWFPDEFHPPSDEVCQWVESWLTEDGERTLIYVGRDFDAAPGYWRKIAPLAPPNQASEVTARRLEAEAYHDGRRLGRDARIGNQWFDLQTDLPPRSVTTLAGPWANGINASKVEIVLGDRLLPHLLQYQAEDPGQPAVDLDDPDILLRSEQDVLVYREEFDAGMSFWASHDDKSSQLILVANGSFLLNLPLVNHEHRKLAARLIESAGSPSRVVFLESGPGDPTLHEQEPAIHPPLGFEVFWVWPLNVILLHLAAVGVLFCFARWPIFGVPRDQRPAAAADFGTHVAALGELLEITRDAAFAKARLLHYQQITRSDTGGPRTKVLARSRRATSR